MIAGYKIARATERRTGERTWFSGDGDERITPGWEKLSGTANCELQARQRILILRTLATGDLQFAICDLRLATGDWRLRTARRGSRLETEGKIGIYIAEAAAQAGGTCNQSALLGRIASCKQLVPSSELRAASCQESRIRRYEAIRLKPIVALDAGVAVAAKCSLHSTNLATNATFWF